MTAPASSSNPDADAQIQGCLSPEAPQSFFLYAGAGSGKTRSLIEALKFLRDTRRDRLRVRGQKIAVITYTNKACDEIKERMEHDYLIEVSTIHSFVWSLIEGYDADIKAWIAKNLAEEVQELTAAQAKGRAGSKASVDRPRQIQAKTERLHNLPQIKKFTYNPNGENFGQDSLNHAEVLQIGAHFLSSKPAMQSILVNRYPVLLIDESQDTNKHLIDALFIVEEKHSAVFTLGLFGDMMQRIYFDGKENLGQGLPDRWIRPEKTINYRCPKRVVSFINKIRSERDKHVQEPKAGAEEGCLHFFLLPATTPQRGEAERQVRAVMATKANDPHWESQEQGAVKTLILEHHMAAKRMGFWPMYEPLYENDRLKIGLMTGDLPGLRFFSNYVLPLLEAYRADDKFTVARIIREHSPLLDKNYLHSKGQEQTNCIPAANEAVSQVMALWGNNGDPTFLDVLLRVAETKLFSIPESLSHIAARTPEERQLPDDSETGEDKVSRAWDQFLATPFSQMKPYVSYVSGAASFDTHQGIKGLEFERVMVIIDDAETRGNWFDYEKLFGAKAETSTDLKNRKEGKETGNDRTRRLLYVTSSRAEKSLAIVFFAENPTLIRNHVIGQQWFTDDEITVA